MTSDSDLADSASTGAVAAEARTEFWGELISTYHRRRLGYRFRSRQDFRGRAVLRRTATYQLVGWQADSVTFYRTAGQIRADPDDDYRLIVPTAGAAVIRQGNDQVPISSGAGALVTINRPFSFSHGDGSTGLTMAIPYRELDHRLGHRAEPARLVDLTSGLGRLVADMATGLVAERGALTQRQFDAAAERLVELLCMHIVGDHPTETGHLASIEAAVRQYIRAHASDLELTGAGVARALGWSVRQIQLALQAAGMTPRELIKEERLRLAHSRLQDPAFAHWSIGSLASGLGFGSASTFSTDFRRRFGASPRDIRRPSRRPRSAPSMGRRQRR
ncbi:helix-turn-helix domain-containing protein [Nocardia australiensis]|uniref:AraC-like ligand-binding domain-containing protein n=1 Tax=Nocardia australiensis TaxID=2887191 RepID=UPI001D134C70|nr:helix-turn-helix domain-containing protein [Nocardia australiensis]